MAKEERIIKSEDIEEFMKTYSGVGKSFVFDTESDNLYADITKFHVFCLHDLDENTFLVFRQHQSWHALRLLSEADLIIGHNIIDFDIPSLEKIYQGWHTYAKIRDTLVLCRLLFGNIAEDDHDSFRQGLFPGKLIGRHSLKSWGYRLGVYKGAFGDEDVESWREWSKEMEDYCVQDVRVNVSLWRHIQKKINNWKHPYPEEPIVLEHAYADLISNMTKNGFPFDEEKAKSLYKKLQDRKLEVESELKKQYGCWYTPTKYVDGVALVETPKRSISYRDASKPSKVAGASYCPVKLIEFNPSSRAQIIDRLQKLYGWQPTVFTESGRPSLSKKVLDDIAGIEDDEETEVEQAVKKIPEASLLAEYFMLEKRIGQVYEGKNGWLKLVSPDGRIHGAINSCGAVTRRCTHNKPNVAQVPRVSAPFGYEMRSCWTVPEGWIQFGVDLSSIELRLFSHFLAEFDNGEYAHEVTNGDVHKKNTFIFDLCSEEEYCKAFREIAKTTVYALIYGAGLEKLGRIVGKGEQAGKRIKENFMKGVPAYSKVLKKIAREYGKTGGFLFAIDGGHLPLRSEHKALNTLIQSGGAIIFKKWSLLIDEYMQDRGFVHSWNGDYVFIASVHDEMQVACKTNEVVAAISEIVKLALSETQEYYKIRCNLECATITGKNWAECH